MDINQNYYERFSRTSLLIGKENLEKLFKSKVLVVGLGGVGSYAFEALVRAGVGTVHIIDFDAIEISNCNRQLLALGSTIGIPKVDVAEKRAKDINPDVMLNKNKICITPDNVHELIPHDIDFAVDAIDDVDAKTSLITTLLGSHIPFISCMGAAHACNPESLRISDISKTQYCPLARTMRKRLKNIGIAGGFMCVYFHEERTGSITNVSTNNTRGSLSYMPGIMGLAAAGYAINFLMGR